MFVDSGGAADWTNAASTKPKNSQRSIMRLAVTECGDIAGEHHVMALGAQARLCLAPDVEVGGKLDAVRVRLHPACAPLCRDGKGAIRNARI
ncbi:hypothetical protein [Roseovarius atlanticus]|uniref:hypothetical protein n=1 Tax=Roseovarius atlanticus TaxID=1641875 RepID=UPI001C96C93E|nr:hypothetical protein [Roseovarius atlanticus]MBY5987300.1 hypothetical protein [Roseovarius atlanticus]MBY6125940.1 hypothetical protein [Roseovarius atlanticus]MBY6149600.1 hypothetical protein [Roseovarius atlanticus]